jgi:acetyltransferase
MEKSEVLETFQSKGGQLVTLRLLRPEDAPLLVDIFEHMSSTSRYHRFNQSVDNVSPDRILQEASTIAESDLGKKLGVIAFADLPNEPNAPIGAARLVQTGHAQAEVALSVRDDMHSQGVGTHMLRKLACLARQNGYRELIASIRHDNPAVWQVFSRLPFEVIRTPAGAYSDITVDLTKPQEILTKPPLPALD